MVPTQTPGPSGNAPRLEPEMGRFVNTRRVIGNDAEGMQVCDQTILDARKLITDAALVQRRLNNAPPYDLNTLKEDQKAWKSNVSAALMPATIGRLCPKLEMKLKTAKYLTMSTLPSGYVNAADKTEKYRSITTRFFRMMGGSPSIAHNFTKRLVREMVSFGYCGAGYFDPFDWRPRVWRKDQVFIPVGTNQDDDPAIVVITHDYDPHELLEVMGSPEMARELGWDVDVVVAAINEAAPRALSGMTEQFRELEDLVRQSSASLSYVKGANVVQTTHLFAREASGKVSHYIYSKSKQKALFKREDRFNSMSDIITFFCFELGDGTIQGSLGVGQLIYDLVRQSERGFNDMNDALRARSKMFLNVPEASSLARVKRHIFDDFTIVSGVDTVPSNPMPAVVEEHKMAFEFYNDRIEALVGSYMPRGPENQPKTAEYVRYLQLTEAELEQATLDNLVLRWGQFFTGWQRRMAQPFPADEFVAAYQKEILNAGLSQEEFQIIASAPAVESIVDLSEGRAQAKAQFYQMAKQSPFFNQREVAKAEASLFVSQEEVEQLLNSDEDPSNVAQQTRAATMENTTLNTGVALQVDLRSDNNLIHLDVHEPVLDRALQAGDVPTAAAYLNHYAAHVDGAIANRELQGDAINELKARYADRVKMFDALQRGLEAQAAQNQISGESLQAIPPTQ